MFKSNQILFGFVLIIISLYNMTVSRKTVVLLFSLIYMDYYWYEADVNS